MKPANTVTVKASIDAYRAAVVDKMRRRGLNTDLSPAEVSFIEASWQRSLRHDTVVGVILMDREAEIV